MPKDDRDPYDPDEYDPGWDDNRPVRKAKRLKSKSSSRGWLILGGIVVTLSLLCCGGLVYFVWWAVGPTSFPEQTEDFADAHAAFKTQLINKGPAPQSWEDASEPLPGVDVVSYTSNGLKLLAWTDAAPKKAGAALKPGLLYLHSGFAFGPEDWEETRPFREAGFIVLIPILRGENGLPGDFTLFFEEVNDAIAAADVLAKRPGVDPNRLFVAGYSAGGTLAMLTAMKDKRFKACATFSGSPDQKTFLRFEPDLPPFDPENQAEIIIRSPLAFPRSFKCPTRLYYGDEELPYKFASEKLARKAQDEGLDVLAVEIPGDHTTMLPVAIRQAITFFQGK